jgi:cell fate regulator YaaT (PSP1 superfamily)
MPDVVGIRFKPVTKVYHFLAPDNTELEIGDPVIVETSRGKELGWVSINKKAISDTEVKGKLKTILRRATPIDLMKMNEFDQKRENALEKCKAKVAELGLPMKILNAEYAFDGSRVTFAFSAEQRVDFRDLVRALVRTLRARVEMRQVGARDEAKIIDGYGRCGRQLCCSSWLTEFHPVSIRMAKNQQLPLAPTEISGVCGRLLCCLAYEDRMYTELRKSLPKVGSKIQLEEGEGVVRGLNILKQTVIVELPETKMRVEMPVPGQEDAEEGAQSETSPRPESPPPTQQTTQPRSKSRNKGTDNRRKESSAKQSSDSESVQRQSGAKPPQKSRKRQGRSRSRSQRRKNQP